jgi:hypothetical protein
VNRLAMHQVWCHHALVRYLRMHGLMHCYSPSCYSNTPPVL